MGEEELSFICHQTIAIAREITYNLNDLTLVIINLQTSSHQIIIIVILFINKKGLNEEEFNYIKPNTRERE